MLTTKQLAAMLADYRAGAGPTELGRRYGCSPDTVYYHARAAGINRSWAEAMSLRGCTLTEEARRRGGQARNERTTAEFRRETAAMGGRAAAVSKRRTKARAAGLAAAAREALRR